MHELRAPHEGAEAVYPRLEEALDFGLAIREQVGEDAADDGWQLCPQQLPLPFPVLRTQSQGKGKQKEKANKKAKTKAEQYRTKQKQIKAEQSRSKQSQLEPSRDNKKSKPNHAWYFVDASVQTVM